MSKAKIPITWSHLFKIKNILLFSWQPLDMNAGKKSFLHPVEKRTLSIFLFIVNICLFLLIMYILGFKLGKSEGIQNACVFLGFIIFIINTLIFLVQGLSKKKSFLFSLLIGLPLLLIILFYPSYHLKMNIKNTIETKGILTQIEKTRFGYAYVITFNVDNVNYTNYTIHPKLFTSAQLSDSMLVHYVENYPAYNYVNLVSKNNRVIR